jgi:undecaprenyl-diphosphatase
MNALPLHPVRRFTRRSAIGLMAVVAVTAVVGVLLAFARRGWPLVVRGDRVVSTLVSRVLADHTFARSGLANIAALGRNTVMWWMVSVTAAGMLLRRQLRLTAFLVVTGLGALVLAPIAGRLAGMLVPADGFPSRYALNATVFYGAMLLVFLPIVPYRLRGLASGVMGVIVAVIGFAHLAVSGARLSDVVAGSVVGVAWLLVTAHAFRLWRLETGRSVGPWSDGLDPDARPYLGPATTGSTHRAGQRALTLAVGWLALAGALYGLGVLITAHPPVLDEAVPRWLAEHRTARLTALSELCSQTGGTRWIVAVAALAAPLAIALTHRWRPGTFLVVVMLGEGGLFLVLTTAVGRVRPLVSHLDGGLPTSSYPSGHVAAALCLYGALAVLLVPRLDGWRRWPAVLLAALVPALVGLSRMYRGEHHPLDLFGSLLLAAAWLAIVTVVVHPNVDLDNRRSTGHEHPDRLAA